MKILTLSILVLAAIWWTAGAQEAAPSAGSAPAQSTAQEDRKFLQNLEQTDKLGQDPVQRADAPVAPVAETPSSAKAIETQPEPAATAKKNAPAARKNNSGPVKATTSKPVAASVAPEKPQMESKAVEKKSKKETVAEVAEGQRVESADRDIAEPIESRSVKKVNRDKRARAVFGNFALGNDDAAQRTDPTSVRSSVAPAAPPVGAARPTRTVTITKTTAAPPPETPRDHEDGQGFFQRLFRHKDRTEE